MSTTNGNGLLDELLEAMKQDDDPKRLTQKQADRLCKRVAEIAEIQIKKVEDGVKDLKKAVVGCTITQRYYHSDQVDESIDNDILALDYIHSSSAAHVKACSVLRTAFDKHVKANNNSDFSVKLPSLVPKAEIKKRRAFAVKQVSQLTVRRDAAIASIENDKNAIIDAAIFYKSEQVIDILAKFEDKEYFS